MRTAHHPFDQNGNWGSEKFGEMSNDMQLISRWSQRFYSRSLASQLSLLSTQCRSTVDVMYAHIARCVCVLIYDSHMYMYIYDIYIYRYIVRIHIQDIYNHCAILLSYHCSNPPRPDPRQQTEIMSQLV